MSAYCTCQFPQIKVVTPHKEHSCEICGHWLDPKANIVLVDDDGTCHALGKDLSPEQIASRVKELDAAMISRTPKGMEEAELIEMADRMEQNARRFNSAPPPPYVPPNAATYRIAPDPKPDVGRNDPCPCGSGKKYKKCHG